MHDLRKKKKEGGYYRHHRSQRHGDRRRTDTRYSDQTKRESQSFYELDRQKKGSQKQRQYAKSQQYSPDLEIDMMESCPDLSEIQGPYEARRKREKKSSEKYHASNFQVSKLFRQKRSKLFQPTNPDFGSPDLSFTNLYGEQPGQQFRDRRKKLDKSRPQMSLVQLHTGKINTWDGKSPQPVTWSKTQKGHHRQGFNTYSQTPEMHYTPIPDLHIPLEKYGGPGKKRPEILSAGLPVSTPVRKEFGVGAQVPVKHVEPATNQRTEIIKSVFDKQKLGSTGTYGGGKPTVIFSDTDWRIKKIPEMNLQFSRPTEIVPKKTTSSSKEVVKMKKFGSPLAFDDQQRANPISSQQLETPRFVRDKLTPLKLDKKHHTYPTYGGEENSYKNIMKKRLQGTGTNLMQNTRTENLPLPQYEAFDLRNQQGRRVVGIDTEGPHQKRGPYGYYPRYYPDRELFNRDPMEKVYSTGEKVQNRVSEEAKQQQDQWRPITITEHTEKHAHHSSEYDFNKANVRKPPVYYTQSQITLPRKEIVLGGKDGRPDMRYQQSPNPNLMKDIGIGEFRTLKVTINAHLSSHQTQNSILCFDKALKCV